MAAVAVSPTAPASLDCCGTDSSDASPFQVFLKSAKQDVLMRASLCRTQGRQPKVGRAIDLERKRDWPVVRRSVWGRFPYLARLLDHRASISRPYLRMRLSTQEPFQKRLVNPAALPLQPNHIESRREPFQNGSLAEREPPDYQRSPRVHLPNLGVFSTPGNQTICLKHCRNSYRG